MKKIKVIIFFIFNFIFVTVFAQKADMVIYSFDRPLQLYALLESVERYISHLEEMHVIYRTSSDAFNKAYNTVEQRFSDVHFIKQGNNPEDDFKQLTVKAVLDSPSDYIIFAVDDIVVKDVVDISNCVGLLETTKAYGFYLRLGTNLCAHYTPMGNKKNIYESEIIPEFNKVDTDILSWRLDQAQYTWAYQNTVDMTLYRKKDIEEEFKSMPYTNPNTIEMYWSALQKKNRIGLCYTVSKIVNIPLNRVQDICTGNRHMGISVHDLLAIFNAGLKIDIQPFYRVNNKSAHTEYQLSYIKR